MNRIGNSFTMRVGAMRGRNTIWNRIGWALFTAIAATVLIRAAVVASHTEGGWRILGDHIIGGMPPFLHAADFDREIPGHQVCRWLLGQANRVQADSNSSAAEIMGAAQLLDLTYPNHQGADPRQLGLVFWNQNLLHNETLESINEFFERAWIHSRELAATATGREPTRADWWRLRAAMMTNTHGSPYSVNGSILLPMDAAVLQTCAEHDPENALYEYLLGYDLFRRAEETIKASGQSPDAKHTELLTESKNHYEAALDKPLLATGENGLSCVSQFLKNAPGPITFKLASSPANFDFSHLVLIQAVKWPVEPPRNGLQAGIYLFRQPGIPADAEIASWFAQQDLQFWQWPRQWRAAHESSLLLASMVIPESFFAFNGPIAGSRWTDESHDSASVTAKAQRISQASTAHVVANQSREFQHQSEKIWLVVPVALASTGWILLMLGIVVFLISRPWQEMAERTNVTTSPLWAVVSWLFVFAATFAFFGILPTFELRLTPYRWWIAGAAATLILLPTVWIFWRVTRFVLHQGRLPAAQRSPLYRISRWSLAIAAAAVFVVASQMFAQDSFRYIVVTFCKGFPDSVVTEHGAPGGASNLSDRLDLWRGTPAWAIVQWGVHGGLLWTTGIWLVLIWDFHWRPASRMRGPLFASASEDRDRNRLMGCLRPVGKSAVLFGLVFLLAGVGAATHWIEILQNEYDERIARLGDPAWDLKQAGLNSLESEVPWPIRKLVPPQIE